MDEEHISDDGMDTSTDETDSDTETETSSTSSSSSTSTEADEEEPVNEKITVKVRKDRSRGKWKLLCDRSFIKKEWFERFPWIEENPDDPKSAKCQKCHTSMKALRGILESHQRSKKHIRAMGGLIEPKKEKEKEKEVSKAEKPLQSTVTLPQQQTALQQQPQPSTPQPPLPSQSSNIGGPTLLGGMDQITDDHISFFTESPADAAHQAVTSLIDKLVEKYHENRLANLKVQNETLLQLNVERAKLLRSENQRKLDCRLYRESLLKETEETHLKFLQLQHETRINAMEDERDAKLRAVEQELVFAKQEYEKKVRLLDSQLCNMK